MSRSANAPTPQQICDILPRLQDEAGRFTAPDRIDAAIRKWTASAAQREESPYRIACMMADAALLAADLSRSTPSATGSTPFDRLAKNRPAAQGAEAAAIAALRQARYRLLTMAGPGAARDALSGKSLRLIGRDMAPLAGGLTIFARVVMIEGDAACLPGAITPLDAAALAIARQHPNAANPGQSSNARWAEAVFVHIVRHGTLDIAGLNRPDDDGQAELFGDAGDPMAVLARDWRALAGAAPGPALLLRTRQMASAQAIFDALAGSLMLLDAGKHDAAAIAQRIASVFMDTILRREHSGSGTMTLDQVARMIDADSKSHLLAAGMRPLFDRLRRALSPGTHAHDDLALGRLMQRIQGLRAKTTAQGCTEQEALAAAEKVAELLDRHGLSLGELDFRAQPCEGIGIQTTRRRLGPIDSCVPVIGEFFDCRVWLEHAGSQALRYVFFGLRADVAASRYLYELIERAFDTETDIFRAGDLYAGMAGERRRATNSFQIGLASGISAKLRTLRAARDAHRISLSGRDLVVVKAAMVDAEIEKLGLDLRAKGGARARHVLTDAYDAGKIAGQQFTYTPGISSAA
jgi:hypothetical protein